MQRCIPLRVSVLVAAAISITTQTARAQFDGIVNDSLLLYYNAAFNSLADQNQWENLGSLPDAHLVPFDADAVHTFNGMSEESYYSMPEASSEIERGEGLVLPEGFTLRMGGISFTAEVRASLVENFVPGRRPERQIFGINGPAQDGSDSLRNRVRVSTNNVTGDPDLVDIILNAGGGNSFFDADAGNEAGPVDMSSGEWFNLVTVWDHPTRTLSLYANSEDPELTGGDLRYRRTHPNEMADVEYHLHLFGSGPNPDERRWPGDISLFRLYERALTEEEIQQNFDAGGAIVPAGDPRTVQPGDVNIDGEVGTADVVQILAANKYERDVDATWTDGDVNGAPNPDFKIAGGIGPPGDGRVNSTDVVNILAANLFETGQYVAEKNSGEGDGKVVIDYDPNSGNVSVRTSAPISSFQLESASGAFTGEAAQGLGGPFDVDSDGKIFKATFGDQFSEVDFGPAAQTKLSESFLLNDLSATGSFAAGGTFGDQMELNYVPEPSTLVLCLLAAAGLVGYGWRRY